MWQNPINHPMFTGLFARMSLRNKLILTASIAFLFGAMLRGSGGSVGRYQFSPSNTQFIMDTQTGETFQYSAEDHQYKHFASVPWR